MPEERTIEIESVKTPDGKSQVPTIRGLEDLANSLLNDIGGGLDELIKHLEKSSKHEKEIIPRLDKLETRITSLESQISGLANGMIHLVNSLTEVNKGLKTIEESLGSVTDEQKKTDTHMLDLAEVRDSVADLITQITMFDLWREDREEKRGREQRQAAKQELD